MDGEKTARVETITIRVEPELLAAVRVAADREARSVAGYVRALLLRETREAAHG